MAKKRLGKGMDALFFEASEENAEADGATSVRISEIEPNKSQPRRNFDEEAIVSLADSIRQHGVLQPILVRPLPAGGYQIVAGERRWRAARLVGLSRVPVFIKEMSDLETMQVALIENLQREDLNPMEEAEGFENLMTSYKMTQEQVAETLGRSRSAIANSLRLLKLDEHTADLVKEGELSAGHARALVSVEDEKTRTALADRTVSEKLSVRQLEKLVTALSQSEKKSGSVRISDTYAREIEISLNESLGRKTAKVTPGAKGKYTVKLSLANKEQLKQFAQLCAGFDSQK